MKTSDSLRAVLTEPDHIKTALELFEKHRSAVSPCPYWLYIGTEYTDNI